MRDTVASADDELAAVGIPRKAESRFRIGVTFEGLTAKDETTERSGSGSADRAGVL